MEWILDDYHYFGMNRFSSTRPYTPPSDVYEVWAAEFDVAYEEGGMLLLTMHPSTRSSRRLEKTGRAGSSSPFDVELASDRSRSGR